MLGKWLEEDLQPSTSIAVAAAGAIPYYAQRMTIDMRGLNDLHIAHEEMPIDLSKPRAMGSLTLPMLSADILLLSSSLFSGAIFAKKDWTGQLSGGRILDLVICITWMINQC